MAELDKLTPDKRALFNALKARFIEEQRELAMKEEAAALEEEQANEERRNLLEQMSAAKREMLLNLDLSKPIDELPDCQAKFEKIEEEYCNEAEAKYTDAQWDHADEGKVLGEKIFNEPAKRYIKSWKRASEMEGAVLFRDGASHEDVTQGALGDCYFLSALSVLGNVKIKDIFISERDEDMERWRKTGAFLLRFFKNGLAEYVIVDDWLPLNAEGQPAFTKGGTDGLELWPAILEKGYAKLYSSYAFIEAGKV